MTSLLILGGFLPETSYLRVQLGIDSVFDLRMQDSVYRDLINQRMVAKIDDVEMILADYFDNHVKTSDLKLFLNTEVPHWRKYKNIILYPARLFFDGHKALEILIQKLHFADTPCVCGNGPKITSLPTSYLDDPSQADRLVEHLDQSLGLEIDRSARDLSMVKGMFTTTSSQSRSRHFNSIEIKPGPYITKMAKNSGKLKCEYDFFKSLPTAIRPYFPMVGEYNSSTETESYEIEFIKAFDFSRFFLHQSLLKEDFLSLLASLTQYFNLCPREQVVSDSFNASFESLFVTKLKTRVDALYDDQEQLKFIQFTELIHPGGLRSIVDHLSTDLMQQMHKVSKHELAFSHGDLCFSNILFDRITGQVKFIDPRGDESTLNNYRPVHYDLAKLSHSFMGCYDLIMNGLCQISLNERLSFSLEFELANEYLHSVRQVFAEWIQSMGYDLKLIRQCEASLFFSMLPLHKDKPNYMVQQFIAGLTAMQDSQGANS